MTFLHFLSLHILDICILHLFHKAVNPYMQHFFNVF
nr:MAG TPA: hypothetical protein [Caudoviricetes sp.]